MDGGVRVSALWLYPVKGCAALPVERVEVDAFGPRGDRRYAVVDADGRFLSQRQAPALARVRGLPLGDGVRLAVPGHPPVRVAPAAGADAAPVVIWDDVVRATFPSPAADRALSAFLARPCRLAWMAPEPPRAIAPPWGRPGDRVAFADGFPFLLASEGSLAALNERLAEPVPMLRFRPGIVVSGAAAWAEDAWRRIAIGEVTFEVAKPCARCVVTTLDPATGRPTGREPLRTLSRVRGWEGKAWFGQNLIHRAFGAIAVGDPVRVLERGEPRPPIGAEDARVAVVTKKPLDAITSGR